MTSLREGGAGSDPNAPERWDLSSDAPRGVDAFRGAGAIGAGDLQTGRVNPGHGKEQLLLTRRDVERGWASVSQLLKLDGDVDLADRVQQFAREMPPAFADREWMAADIMHRLRISAP